ncbi:cupin domain-containing protein [Actinomadura syzygii]|uniref:Cupin domain-containing protein n=1 Tax=Actinomadura syzygii TaxID=1427538 RepID=A0A5D0U641_9ACTN|nr:cupin domain-containing protein [Actinomadura syzygii]TYC13200.1 cupin domain-containing protein [Actinomadura syzygii]
MTAFQYVRPAEIPELAEGQRFSTVLIGADSGGAQSEVRLIVTPPGGGSPRGLHTHRWEQLFYVLDGVMAIEVDGQRHDVGPGNLIVFPAEMPHRNWNETDANTVHLAINAPMPPSKAPKNESAIGPKS